MAFDVKTATDDQLFEQFEKDRQLLPTLVGWLYPPIVRQEMADIQEEIMVRGLSFSRMFTSL